MTVERLDVTFAATLLAAAMSASTLLWSTTPFSFSFRSSSCLSCSVPSEPAVTSSIVLRGPAPEPSLNQRCKRWLLRCQAREERMPLEQTMCMLAITSLIARSLRNG